MELLMMIQAAKLASAKRVTAVIPWFPYSRQDKKSAPREPVTGKLVADFLMTAGVDRVLTMDLHAGQIQGFFDIPTDNLLPAPLIAQDIRDQHGRKASELMIVSPDVGGVVRARALANRLGADLAIVDKRRSGPGKSEVMNIIGDVEGRSCILFDDIVDSAGTLCNAAKALTDHGATEVSAYVTHGVLSDPAAQRITDSVMREVVVTDSIEAPDHVMACEKIRQVSCASLIGEAIRRIANEESVSKLFD